jgi:hypothetical protein
VCRRSAFSGGSWRQPSARWSDQASQTVPVRRVRCRAQMIKIKRNTTETDAQGKKKKRTSYILILFNSNKHTLLSDIRPTLVRQCHCETGGSCRIELNMACSTGVKTICLERQLIKQFELFDSNIIIFCHELEN